MYPYCARTLLPVSLSVAPERKYCIVTRIGSPRFSSLVCY